MKKLIILLMAVLMVFPVYGQEPETPAAVEAIEPIEAVEPVEKAEETVKPAAPVGDTVDVIGRVEVIETPEQTRVTLGKNEVIIVEENGDTVIVGLGSKGISIVEGKDGVAINVIDMEQKKSSHKKKHKKKFNPHWAGLQVGLNNYLTPDFSLVLPPGEEYMDLNTGKSWAWNINVADVGIGFGTSYVGLGTGLGFEFINYNFDGQNSIMKDRCYRKHCGICSCLCRIHHQIENEYRLHNGPAYAGVPDSYRKKTFLYLRGGSGQFENVVEHKDQVYRSRG